MKSWILVPLAVSFVACEQREESFRPGFSEDGEEAVYMRIHWRPCNEGGGDQCDKKWAFWKATLAGDVIGEGEQLTADVAAEDPPHQWWYLRAQRTFLTRAGTRNDVELFTLDGDRKILAPEQINFGSIVPSRDGLYWAAFHSGIEPEAHRSVRVFDLAGTEVARILFSVVEGTIFWTEDGRVAVHGPAQFGIPDAHRWTYAATLDGQISQLDPATCPVSRTASGRVTADAREVPLEVEALPITIPAPDPSRPNVCQTTFPL